MGKHSLWFIRQWLWKKLRRDKVRTKQKEIIKLLSAKKAGNLAKRSAKQLESESFSITKSNDTPKKIKGAAKRILTNA